MADLVQNVTYASPVADAKFAQVIGHPQIDSYLAKLADVSAWQVVITILCLMVAYDQFSYLWQKGSIIGPAWKAPLYRGELSCVSVFHKFVVIASTRDMARKVFNSPAYVKPCVVVDSAHKLLGETNWVFLDGKAHVDFRKGLNGLFTRKALDCYLPGQDDVYNQYQERFAKVTEEAGGKPVPFMSEFRELLCAVSCRTFVGFYISDEAIKKIADDYYNITAALELVNFPIILPFTKSWYGKIAAEHGP
ncbi:hypothetical protein DID88_005781 [Monilinia fructigena]|uniref:Cytochrome P450 n=1 Tax=Monilinia fructigena TaxID=38457 RepID=A0A395J0S5_9HELO|nr:hypothetical protein DID88_005781 [Monilinia fructigena]